MQSFGHDTRSAKVGGSTPPRWLMVVVEAREPTYPTRDRPVAQRQRVCGVSCPLQLLSPSAKRGLTSQTDGEAMGRR